MELELVPQRILIIPSVGRKYIAFPRNHGPAGPSSAPIIYAGRAPDHIPSSSLGRKRLRAHRLGTLSTRPVDTSLRCTTSPLLPLQLSGASFKVSPRRPGLGLDGAISRLCGLAVLEVALDASAALRLVAVGLGTRLALRRLAELCRVVDGAGRRAGEAAQGVCLTWDFGLRVRLEGVFAGSCARLVHLRAELGGGVVANLDSWLVLVEGKGKVSFVLSTTCTKPLGLDLLLHV